MTWWMIPVDLQKQECHQRIRGKRKELMLEPTSENGGNADLQLVLLYNLLFDLRKVQASNPIPPPVCLKLKSEKPHLKSKTQAEST